MTADGMAGERCTATSKRTGRRCGQVVIGGGTCRWHGGAAPQVERQRQVRVAVAEAKDLFAERFEAREWYDALPAAAALCDQLMQALRSKVELAGTLTASEIDSLAQLTERVARLAKLVQDSDIDERRVRISEAQAALVFDVLQGVLSDLGLSLTEPRVQKVLAERLTPLTAGATS